MVSLSLREVALIFFFQLPWLLSDFYYQRKCSSANSGIYADFLNLLKYSNGISFGSTGKFTVVGPQQPIVALVGGEAVFHCHLFPQKNAEGFEIMWFHKNYSRLIHHYKDEKDERQHQHPEYQGRTILLKENISSGNVALRLSNIQLSDEGKYLCQFTTFTSSHAAEFQVSVTGIGSAPHVDIEVVETKKILLMCTSEGWYPKPEMQWRNSQGKILAPISMVMKQDYNGLFSVKTSVMVLVNSKESISCFIRNPILNQTKETSVFWADDLFPRTSSWMILLIICETVAILLLLASNSYNETFEKIKGQMQRPLEEERWHSITPLSCEKEQTSPEGRQKKKTEESSLSPEYQIEETQQGDQRKMERHLSPSPAILMRPDLQIAQKHRVDVTLDADTAHPFLLLRKDGKSVLTCSHELKKPSRSERFASLVCVLAKESFTSGRCYWEVKVENKMKWTVGFCKDSVFRKGEVQVTQESGFWSISLKKGNEYWALSSPPTQLYLVGAPKIVGIFLDYKAGWISFYNVTDNTHIYTFQDTFQETLRPFICTGPLSEWENIVPISIPSQSQGNRQSPKFHKAT